MPGIRTAFKKKLKAVLQDHALKEYLVEIMDRTILVTFVMKKGSVRSITIKKKKYAANNNTVKIPFRESVLDSILSGSFKIVFRVYDVSFKTDIDKSKLRYLGEKYKYGKKKYDVSEDKLIQISGIESGDEGLVFSYTPIGDMDGEVKLILTNSKPEKTYEGKAVDDGRVAVEIDEDDRKLWGSRLKLAAVDDTHAIPVILNPDISSFNELTAEQQGNYIIIKRNDYDSYDFLKNSEIRTVPPLFNDNAGVRFTIDYKEGDVLLSSSILYMEQDVSFFWRSLLTGEEVEAASFKAGQKVAFYLKEFLLKERAPFDRDVLIYYYGEDRDPLNSHYAFMNISKSRIFQDHIIISNDNNEIVYTIDNLLILENKECFLSYQEKYEYDFGTSSFKTEVTNVVVGEDKISFDLNVTSLLSPISELEYIVRDYYKKRSVKLGTQLLDEETLHFKEKVELDLTKLENDIYENRYLTFRLGVLYSDGYKEEGTIRAVPRRFTALERYVGKSPEKNGMVIAAFFEESSYELKLWYTTPAGYTIGVQNQAGRDIYYKTVKEDFDDHMIFFEADLGRKYAGNPKYIYEYMISHHEYDHFKYVWTYPDVRNCPIPGDPIIVKRGTADYFYYLAKAKYRINNYRFFPITHKKAGAVYLNTWHGTPLKKLGFDIENEGPDKHEFALMSREILNWDYLAVDNDYGEKKLTGAFHFNGSVIKKGYPINDIYFDNERKEKAISRLENKYPALKGRKMILYAPTWRAKQDSFTRKYCFEMPFDTGKLRDEFGDDFVLVVKPHGRITESIAIDEKYKDFIVDASDEEDIMELLCRTDILITDYSSVFYDFASARKPILFYMYDLKQFASESGGLYVDTGDLPGPVIKDESGLVEQIRKLRDGEYEYGEKLKAFCSEFGRYCKGTSARDVVEAVIEKEDLR